MPTIGDICHAFAPESLERSPHLPTSHHQGITASQHCRSGHYDHSLYQCQRGGQHRRVYHGCGTRHCPPGQQHKTPQGLPHPLDNPRPGPPCLVTVPGPETLRPFIRSQQRLASQALCNAASPALKRLAQEERCIGPHRPGFPGLLHTWGRQLPYHPHLHSIVPGGGLSEDRPTGRPSRAHVSGPVTALAPRSRAVFQQALAKAGRLPRLAPQVWPIPWNVPSPAKQTGHSAGTALAPYVCKVAISNRRVVSLTERSVTFSSRNPGRARARTTPLDAIECIRRCLPPVLPDGVL
jgi:hypothetical protein